MSLYIYNKNIKRCPGSRLVRLEGNGVILEVVHLIIPNVLGRILRTFVECGKWQRFLGLAQRKNCVVNVDQTIGGAGHSAALHPHHIVFGIDAPNAQTLDDSPTVAHVTGHLGAGPDATLFTATTNVAGTSMRLSHTMGGGHALEAVTLNHTLEAMIHAARESGTVRREYDRERERVPTYVLPRTSTNSPTLK